MKEITNTSKKKFKLAIISSHPVQYQAPLYKYLSADEEIDLFVYYCSKWGLEDYHDPELKASFRWDIDLLDGYEYKFLKNYSLFQIPGKFWSVVNPEVIIELIKNKYDAILIPGYALFSYLLALFGAKITSTPIFFRGETYIKNKNGKLFEKLKKMFLSGLFKNINAFLAIGSQSIEFYKHYNVPDEKIFLTPYAVDNDFFMDMKEKWRQEVGRLKYNMFNNDLPVILFVGKLTDKKRPLDLLKAYIDVKNASNLVFVGDGQQREELEQFKNENELNNVHFAGFKNQTEVTKYYSFSDVFVLPSSVGEVSPLVINEAMASGLAIVASNLIPSAADFVKNGENGYIFNAGSIQELGKYLKVLVGDKGLREKMGKRSKEIINKWSFKEDLIGIKKAIDFIS